MNNAINISRETELSIVLIASILLSGLGPGISNYPISVIAISIFTSLRYLQYGKIDNFKNTKNVLVFPLLILLLIYIFSGGLLVAEGLKISYWFDRLMMVSIFFIYSSYLSTFKVENLLNSGLKTCKIILPFYIFELLVLIYNEELYNILRRILGLRTSVTTGTFALLGYHEPSQLSAFVFFVYAIYFTLKFKKSKHSWKEYYYLYFLAFLTLFFYCGTYISITLFSLILTLSILVIRFLIRSRFLIIRINSLKNIIILISILISLITVGADYTTTKIQISKTRDTSTITRTYPLVRSFFDIKRTLGFGTGAGTYERSTKESNQYIQKALKIDNRINQVLNTEVINNSYKNNDRIPFYSIIGQITSETGIIGFILISLPFFITIYYYSKEIIYIKSIDTDLIVGIFFSLSSYFIMVSGGLRGNILQWFILYLNYRLIRTRVSINT